MFPTRIEENNTTISRVRDVDYGRLFEDGDGHLVTVSAGCFIPIQGNFKPCTLELAETWRVLKCLGWNDLEAL